MVEVKGIIKGKNLELRIHKMPIFNMHSHLGNLMEDLEVRDRIKISFHSCLNQIVRQNKRITI